MSHENQCTLSGVSFPLKAYTVKQLSALYGVSPKTFHRWLAPFTNDIGAKQGYFYNISQVKTILIKLGVPGNIVVE